MKEQLKGLEKDHGNVDLLSHRLSNVRTWSYVANKKNWVENSDYWVQLTKSASIPLGPSIWSSTTKTVQETGSRPSGSSIQDCTRPVREINSVIPSLQD